MEGMPCSVYVSNSRICSLITALKATEDAEAGDEQLGAPQQELRPVRRGHRPKLHVPKEPLSASATLMDFQRWMYDITDALLDFDDLNPATRLRATVDASCIYCGGRIDNT